MTLYQKLQKASSEEDVKDAYIKALQARNASGDFAPVSFNGFETAYRELTDKLQPMVYKLEFLRN